MAVVKKKIELGGTHSLYCSENIDNAKNRTLTFLCLLTNNTFNLQLLNRKLFSNLLKINESFEQASDQKP